VAVSIIRLWPDDPPTRIDGVPEEVEYPVRHGVAAGTTFLRGQNPKPDASTARS
jgi:hypothetical protein